MVFRGRLIALSALAMIVFSTSAGWAATVSLVRNDIVYSAAPGEVNAVVVTEEGLAIRFTDPAAPITAGPGCVADGADALCDFSFLNFVGVHVDLGDGNDSADLTGLDFPMPPLFEAGSVVKGGPGNDHVVGGASFDSFFGDEGDDELIGAEQQDFLYGGPGNDILRGGASGSDELDGGPGDDILNGGIGRPDVVHATGANLRLTPTALFGAGNDTLIGIEHAWLEGGPGRNVINARTWRGSTYIEARRGNDLIVGSHGPDYLIGGSGNDVIAGRGGNDDLSGDGGRDVLFSRDFQRDYVDGGPGRDRARVDGLDDRSNVEAFFQ
jgi:Ca2+-binding RTX toxin-like protein